MGNKNKTLVELTEWNSGFYSSESREYSTPKPSWLDRPVREGTFSSVAEVKKIQACYHEWEPTRCTILGYIKVLARCRKCGTFWNKPGEK